MAETRKCKICGAEMREEHSFVFGTDFYFCPNKCGQTKTESLGASIMKHQCHRCKKMFDENDLDRDEKGWICRYCEEKDREESRDNFGGICKDGMCFVCGKTLNSKNSCPDRDCSSHEGGN